MIKNTNKLIVAIIVLTLITALGGCKDVEIDKNILIKKKVSIPKGLIKAHNLLKIGKIDEALHEINIAKDNDPKEALIYLELARAYEYNKNYKKGLNTLKAGQKYANEKSVEAVFYKEIMRFYTMIDDNLDRTWLKNIESAFYEANRRIPEDSEHFFYMALAYKMIYKFSEAKRLFKKVIGFNKKYRDKASKNLSEITKTERTKPETKIKEIALLSSISRGDIVYLLTKELKIDQLVNLHSKLKNKTAHQNHLADLKKHPLKNDIELIIAIGLKVLKPYQNNNFEPEMPINRGEFAIMIEDIILTVTGHISSFIGKKSLFTDMRNDHNVFNAAMVCINQNIMDSEVPGTFNPNGPVSGAEALLSIRTLRNALKDYYIK
ncbi:putative SLH domain-containing protein [Candidatus Magnetomoraceae bacterium gMMP-15]